MAPDHEAHVILPAHAVAAAEGFLAGRIGLGDMGKEADRVLGRARTVSSASADVPDALLMLLASMQRTSVATGERQKRWRAVMAALTRLVRHEAAVRQ